MPLDTHILDLDGTLTDLDVVGVLEGRASAPEIQHYFIAAARFVEARTGLGEPHIHDGILDVMRTEVFPNREKAEHWGTFGSGEPICPAVDHFLLLESSLKIYLKRQLSQVPKGGTTYQKILGFLANPGIMNAMFQEANPVAASYAEIDEDGKGALEEMLRRNDRIAIVTNSKTEKAVALVTKAGLQEYLVGGQLVPGRIATVGDAMKFKLDKTWEPPEGHSVDLSSYYGEPITLDIRRRTFRERMRILLADPSIGNFGVFSDVPELDLYPMAAEFGKRARCAMRITPQSLPGQIRAAEELLGAKSGPNLSDLLKELD